MTIEATVSLTNGEKTLEFPCLMEGKGNSVFLITSLSCTHSNTYVGTLLKSDVNFAAEGYNRIGKHADNWAALTPFKACVHLEEK